MNEFDNNFQRIVVENIPLIDVRAPVEFKAGSLPQAVNLPLMTDEERHRVGLCYKEKGQAEAVALGYSLVQAEKKSERVQAWAALVARHPEAMLYCARGGLRSEIAQQWLKDEIGSIVPRLAGGYKAFRNYLIDRLDPEKIDSRPVILGGRTGTGKTLLLGGLSNAIDLEAIAHHRGSSFGRFITPQPSQVDFENRLACALIKHIHRGYSWLVLEDEGSHVGKLYLPKNLANFFRTGDLVQLEAPLERRIQITFDEYILGGQAEYTKVYGTEKGISKWLEEMTRSVERIAKRLGPERLQQVKRMQQTAHEKQMLTGDQEAHKIWLRLLLCEYYDPMYDYQLQKKSRSIIFKGEAQAVLEYLLDLEE